MSMMYCFYCDRPIDTDYFQEGHQFFPDFKCEDCLETCDLLPPKDDRQRSQRVVAQVAKGE